MIQLVGLALRNIGRNRRRSLLAFISVAMSTLVIVLLQGFIGGFIESLVKNATKNDTGHVRIATRAFEEKSRFYPVSDNLSNPDSLIAMITRDSALAPKLALVTKRVTFGVVLSNGPNTKTALALAGDPAKETSLLMLQKSICTGGRYLAGPRELIMGIELARDLKYRVGDTVRVMTSGSDYALHLRKFVLVGLFQTGMNALDNTAFQIGLDDARELLRMGDATQQIVVMLKRHGDAEEAAARLRTMLRDTSIAVTPWTQIGETYRTVKLMSAIYDWIFIVIAFLGAFIISNIMVMVVMERRKEIGILKSMGMGSGEVLAIFLTEGALLGVVGSLIGATLGCLIVLYFHYHGIDLSAFMKESTFPIDNVLYPAISGEDFVKALLLGTVPATIVSALPSRRAAQMNVVDALKSV